jgi:ubiquinone/menaquinone biosynthesis C-methylase UbiE
VSEDLRRELEPSGYSRPGFAETYDRFRPRPPPLLTELLPSLAGVERPALVVDLGCGTGLSTRVWADAAEAVVGVEPQEAMRRHATAATEAANVRYVDGSSADTGLDEASADIVTASQSLQWMEPAATFAEVDRILRPEGVFAAYQYESLTTPLWEPEQVLEEVFRRGAEKRDGLGLYPDRKRWPPSAERLEESGVFRFVRELPLLSIEDGDGERLVGFALSTGTVATPLEHVGEEGLGLDRLREVAVEIPEPIPWYLGYRLWAGVK